MDFQVSKDSRCLNNFLNDLMVHVLHLLDTTERTFAVVSMAQIQYIHTLGYYCASSETKRLLTRLRTAN